MLNLEILLPERIPVITSLDKKKRSFASLASAHDEPAGSKPQDSADHPRHRWRSLAREPISIVKSVMALAVRRESDRSAEGPHDSNKVNNLYKPKQVAYRGSRTNVRRPAAVKELINGVFANGQERLNMRSNVVHTALRRLSKNEYLQPKRIRSAKN